MELINEPLIAFGLSFDLHQHVLQVILEWHRVSDYALDFMLTEDATVMRVTDIIYMTAH